MAPSSDLSFALLVESAIHPTYIDDDGDDNDDDGGVDDAGASYAGVYNGVVSLSKAWISVTIPAGVVEAVAAGVGDPLKAIPARLNSTNTPATSAKKETDTALEVEA